jgi:hypothetical protein
VRTKECSASVVEGRLDKASQFMDAAETIREFADEEAEIADAYVTLCVLAGIAAADVICCSRLGRHARGEVKGPGRAADALVEKARRARALGAAGRSTSGA